MNAKFKAFLILEFSKNFATYRNTTFNLKKIKSRQNKN